MPPDPLTKAPRAASEELFGGSRELSGSGAFDSAALEQWLRDNVEGFRGPLKVEQFRGGQSNPTYRLVTPRSDYVLRRKPPGRLVPGAHAVEREFRVTAALSRAVFPVASPHALCLDETIIGTAFYVMEMVHGRIFWDPTMADVDGAQRAALFDAMNAVIARLHRLDVAALGLSDYGRPGNYFERQIARWSRQYREDEAAGRDRHMDALLEWLPVNIPDDEAVSLVHGDFRTDNLIFHPREPRVLAVIDWELSTLGHPLSDFAYHLMMYSLPPHIIGGFAGADLARLAIPSRDDYVAAYCRRTGREGI